MSKTREARKRFFFPTYFVQPRLSRGPLYTSSVFVTYFLSELCKLSCPWVEVHDARFLTFLARSAYRIVLIVSSTSVLLGLTQASNSVLLLPPRESEKLKKDEIRQGLPLLKVPE